MRGCTGSINETIALLQIYEVISCCPYDFKFVVIELLNNKYMFKVKKSV